MLKDHTGLSSIILKDYTGKSPTPPLKDHVSQSSIILKDHAGRSSARLKDHAGQSYDSSLADLSPLLREFFILAKSMGNQLIPMFLSFRSLS